MISNSFQVLLAKTDEQIDKFWLWGVNATKLSPSGDLRRREKLS
jgi:hypothetical protein